MIFLRTQLKALDEAPTVIISTYKTSVYLSAQFTRRLILFKCLLSMETCLYSTLTARHENREIVLYCAGRGSHETVGGSNITAEREITIGQLDRIGKCWRSFLSCPDSFHQHISRSFATAASTHDLSNCLDP